MHLESTSIQTDNSGAVACLYVENGEPELVHTKMFTVVSGSCWKLGQDFGLTPLWGDMSNISVPDTLYPLQA